MKIRFLSTFFPFRGGIAQFNALMYRELEKNHDVEAFTFKRQYPNILFPGQTQYVTENDVADKIPSKAILDTINPFTYLRSARILKRSNPDVVITKYWMTFFAPSLGFVLGRLKGRAIRISVLDNVIPHERRFFDNACNRYFLNRNDGFVVMSDKVLADLLHYKPDAKYVRMDHPVYDQFGARLEQKEALSSLGIEYHPEHKYLLFFGIIRKYKGLDLLIEAMSKLGEDYHLLIAGEVYGSFDEYQSLIDRHNLTHRVHLFNQYIPDDKVGQYFSASDVCVLPYRSATQSGIISISKHFEIPVIATDVGGLKESISHGKTGLMVDHAEPQLIAESIEHYFTGDLKESCKLLIREENERNSWEAFCRRIVDFAAEIQSTNSQ
jgi:glycosyltransferase involved in cell wall biosynthesis